MSFLQKLQLKKSDSKKIEERIEMLKEQLRNVHETYLLTIYGLLKEIYVLRKTQIPSYTIADMAREKGIEQQEAHIRYIFNFEYMSEMTRQLLQQGTLKPTTILTIIGTGVEFRNHENQNALIRKYLNKELTMQDITKHSTYSLLKIIGSKNPMSKKDKIILNAVYDVSRARKTLQNNKEVIKNLSKQQKDNFRKNVARFKTEVSRVVGETIYICPHCRQQIRESELICKK